MSFFYRCAAFGGVARTSLITCRGTLSSCFLYVVQSKLLRCRALAYKCLVTVEAKPKQRERGRKGEGESEGKRRANFRIVIRNSFHLNI